MKKLNFLKAILDLFWFFSVLSSIAIVVFVAMYLFTSNFNIPIEIKGQVINTNSIIAKVTVVANLVSGFLFLYSIYLLRKVVSLFQKKEIFTTIVIDSFSKIGSCIIASALISSISVLVYKAVEKSFTRISLDFGGYDSLLIAVSLGLFFMVISEIFKIAKSIKEESELTI
ncbi:hypothetical protein RCH18_000628 [Flavobacterium sp. PL11]|uniref:DUF2975 domain-containing protein n=1 Tax=Flavobacterium sp. PL11 TaxID=3071717 RepID=UPI002E08F7EF|nr:hypothetical protein [Flavobacterium sp. PL11]